MRQQKKTPKKTARKSVRRKDLKPVKRKTVRKAKKRASVKGATAFAGRDSRTQVGKALPVISATKIYRTLGIARSTIVAARKAIR